MKSTLLTEDGTRDKVQQWIAPANNIACGSTSEMPEEHFTHPPPRLNFTPCLPLWLVITTS